MKPVFCEITSWWNWHYLRNQISPYIFYYPVQLMIEKGFDAEVLTTTEHQNDETVSEYHENLQIHHFARKNLASFSVLMFSHIIRSNYALIHLQGVYWLSDFVSWIGSRMMKTPMVFTSHAHDKFERLLNAKSQISWMSRRISDKWFIKDSPTCVFIAFTKTQAEIYRRLGIENVEIIPHAIDTRAFEAERDTNIREKYNLDEFNVLCVAAMDQRKGQHLLVRSMPRILKEFPHTRLLLVGRTSSQNQKDYLQMCKSETSRLGLGNKVQFLNDVCRDDLIQLYLWSSIFALPTRAEMSAPGLSGMEAMAAGLPIVSTDRPYIREVLGNGEAGILVKREREPIENAILSLLKDDELRRKMGENGKKLIQQNHRLDKVIQQYWELYRSLLNSGS